MDDRWKLGSRQGARKLPRSWSDSRGSVGAHHLTLGPAQGCHSLAVYRYGLLSVRLKFSEFGKNGQFRAAQYGEINLFRDLLGRESAMSFSELSSPIAGSLAE
jgi:hypothetical protein